MALDGGFTYNLVAELQSAVGAHIDKIHQPSRYELVISLRTLSGAKKLLISAVQGKARLHFTQTKPENPDNPPMFCMLIRKYFSSARITEISMDSCDRIVKITASSLNEMGDIIYPCIYVELIGAMPNIVAVLDGKIIDSIRHSSLENEGRIVLPGAIYESPAKPQKYSLLENDSSFIYDKIFENGNITLQKALLETVEGFSPLICREIAFAVSGNTDIRLNELNGYHKKMLLENLKNAAQSIKSGVPQIIFSSGKPIEFSYTPITQYGKAEIIKYESFSELLDVYYAASSNAERVAHAASDILKRITNAFTRAEKRKNQRISDLKKTESREQLRLYGELIKANIYAISPGDRFALVENYYDENLSKVKIPLDTALSPAANAAKYFKNYKKACTASQTLEGLIENDEKEIEYLDSVLDCLSRAETLSDISEIRQELAAAGYIKSQKNGASKKALSAPLEFTSPSGYKISVGKNNRQNDELTLHLSDKNDMWFHIKDSSGSHTVIHCAGNALTNEDIIFAARKAAEHSKAKLSSNVAVDYTKIKFVKKPSGAKPGMVIYSKNETVYVTPDIEI